MPGPFAISNRLTLRLKPEAAFGLVSGAGANYALRVKGETLKYAIQTKSSEELRADRMVSDVLLTDAQAQGGVPFELSYGEFDSLLQGALCAPWGNLIAAGGESAALTLTIATQNAITASAGTPFAALTPGQYVSFTGFATPTNNNTPQQIATVTGAGAGLTFAGTPFTNEAAVPNCKARAARLVNGTVTNSFSIERVNNDLTLFECFRGMMVNSATFTFKPGAVIDCSFDFMGKDALPMAAVTALPGATTASLSNTVLNSVNNFGSFLEGGVAMANALPQSITLSVKNNLRGQKALGVLGNAAIALGEFDCDGELLIYLADATLYNKFINNTVSSLSWMEKDSAGNAYIVTLPRVKYSDAERTATGKNQDIMVKAQFQTLRDPVSGAALIIDRCGSAVTLWT